MKEWKLIEAVMGKFDCSDPTWIWFDFCKVQGVQCCRRLTHSNLWSAWSVSLKLRRSGFPIPRLPVCTYGPRLLGQMWVSYTILNESCIIKLFLFKTLNWLLIILITAFIGGRSIQSCYAVRHSMSGRTILCNRVQTGVFVCGSFLRPSMAGWLWRHQIGC